LFGKLTRVARTKFTLTKIVSPRTKDP